MSNKKPEQYFSSHPTSDMNLIKKVIPIGRHLCTMYMAPGVFSSEDLDSGTRVLIDNLVLPHSGPVLDLGAGYGPLCIYVYKEFEAQKGEVSDEEPPQNSPTPAITQVYASEINERALWLLNRNTVYNKCKEIKILKGDFLAHVPILKAQNIQFNAIYSNPPLKLGHAVILDLFKAAVELLAPNGFLQYVHKKSLGAEGLMQKLKDILPDFSIEVMRKNSGFYIIIISRHPLLLEGNRIIGDSS